MLVKQDLIFLAKSALLVYTLSKGVSAICITRVDEVQCRVKWSVVEPGRAEPEEDYVVMGIILLSYCVFLYVPAVTISSAIMFGKQIPIRTKPTIELNEFLFFSSLVLCEKYILDTFSSLLMGGN